MVAPGDDLWSIAANLLGEGRRWRELAAANPETLTDPTRQLQPGTRLRLPEGAVVPPAAEPAEPVQPDPETTVHKRERVTVERGDTLSGLAQEHLGKASLWPRIARANASLVTDPDHIEIGWKLTIPDRSAGSRPLAARTGSAEPPTAEPVLPPEVGEPAAMVPAAGATAAGTGSSAALGQDGGGSDREPAAPGSSPSAEARSLPDESDAAPSDAAPEQAEAPSEAPDLALIGSLGALVAAGLMGGWEARRLLQSRSRAPGRRVLHPGDDLARFHDALGRRQRPDSAEALAAALRAIGRHFHETALPLPPLGEVLLGEHVLTLNWLEPAGLPPAGFTGDTSAWLVDLASDHPPDAPGHPCPYPALASLGSTPEGDTVLVDVERAGVLGVAAESRELQVASLASMAVELACAPWAGETTLTVVGADGRFAVAAGDGTVTHLATVADGVAALRRRHLQRTRALAGEDLRRLRCDPERADAVAPEVFCFVDPVDPTTQAELDTLLTGEPAGLAAVLALEAGAPSDWQVFGDPLRPCGTLGDTRPLQAHVVPEATREAVVGLSSLAEGAQTTPAPWWDDQPDNVLPLHPRDTPSEDPVEIVNLRRLLPPVPTLLLIGPVGLTGAAGPEPGRARSQLIELASWILEHPGHTASQMAAGLGIAESTRRANLSRLRSWLGRDGDGEPYLPEAYSGRIQLSPEVTSDVQQLRLLTGAGVNRISEPGLVAVLDLVRGDLLADAAPGQWYWAEELRSDVTATLRDAGLVLVDRALARSDVDLARWAAERALAVAPDDELLLCARVRTEHTAGNRAAVERLVARLVQQARMLGVDLLPETVMLCQQVVEGRLRARRA